MISGRAIDLNADLGEGCPWDADLLARITSASIGCGAHAGSPDAILATLGEAARRGVVIGAHPGYPDRANFGRVERAMAASEVEALIVAQVESLRALASDFGLVPQFLKPHGALYNQAQKSEPHALGVIAAARRLGLPVLGQPGGILETIADRSGVHVILEGFADRGYSDDGRLIPRGEPGAVLEDHEAIAAQVVRLANRGVATLCLHGDDARSVPLADLVIAALNRSGIGLRPFMVEAPN